MQYLKKWGQIKLKSRVYVIFLLIVASNVVLFCFFSFIIGEGGHLKEHMKPFKHLR